MRLLTMGNLWLIITVIGFHLFFYLLCWRLPAYCRKLTREQRSIRYDKIVYPAYFFYITEKITIPELHWKLVNILTEDKTKQEYIKSPDYFSSYLILKFERAIKKLKEENYEHINKLLTKEFNEYKSKNQGDTP